jgi:carnitine O-acetyltransferase
LIFPFLRPSIRLNIVCKHLGAERFSFYLNEAACEVRDMLMPDLLAQQEKARL